MADKDTDMKATDTKHESKYGGSDATEVSDVVTRTVLSACHRAGISEAELGIALVSYGAMFTAHLTDRGMPLEGHDIKDVAEAFVGAAGDGEKARTHLLGAIINSIEAQSLRDRSHMSYRDTYDAWSSERHDARDDGEDEE